jgi:formylmethanofuran dehydrogenase subunit E
VQDFRERVIDGEVFCKPCAEGSYYTVFHEERYAK